MKKKLSSGIFHIDGIFFSFAQSKKVKLVALELQQHYMADKHLFWRTLQPAMWEIKHWFITLSVQWNQPTEFIAESRALSELGRAETILKCAEGK